MPSAGRGTPLRHMCFAYLLYQGIAGLSNNIEAFIEILHGPAVRISDFQVMGTGKLSKQKCLILYVRKQLQKAMAVSIFHHDDEISFLYVFLQQRAGFVRFECQALHLPHSFGKVVSRSAH